MRLSILICSLAATLLATTVSLAGALDRTSPRTISTTNRPAFDPLTFFTGHTRSWGVVENRSGRPNEAIVTDCHGETDATGKLHMVQHLSFQDGTTQQRDWILWRSGPERFDATANDMVGPAKGVADGNMFHWRWVLARSPGNALMNVTMNQWMYQLQDGSVMIRTTISKFGVILAEVTEQFTRAETS